MKASRAWSRAGSLATVGLALALVAARAPGGAKAPKESLSNVRLEVQALQTVDSLDLKPKQLEALAALAKETAETAHKRTAAKVSPEYRKVLLDLHAALIKQDEAKVSDLDAQLEDLNEKESPELDADVEITPAARQKAPEFLKLLTAAQLAAYIATKDISDPLEILNEALETGQDQKGEEWKETRDEAAADVANLLGGVDEKRVSEINARLGKLLDKSHAANETKVSEEIEQMVAKVGPFRILHNSVERSLAELLSNPRLSAALEGRKKAAR